MVAAAVLLLSLVVAAAADLPGPTLGSDGSALRARVTPVGPWCHGDPRLQLSLENVSEKPIWIALEHPSKVPIGGFDFAYFDDEGLVGMRTGRGGGDGGDLLSFLRSGQSTRLDPGASAKWLLQVGPVSLHVGRAELTVDGPIAWITNLEGSDLKVYAFEAKVALRVRRAGRCYAARLAGPRADPG
jgi:hypothetical protein